MTRGERTSAGDAAIGMVAFAAVAFGGATGCRRAAQTDEVSAGPRPNPAPVVDAPPVDRTAPNEIAEGTEEAFGLKLPRYMKVTARFADTTFAEGPLAPERVANYVRQRVTARHVDTGPAKTVFTGATPKASGTRTLRVEVLGRPGSTEIMVRDETRASANDGMTPEQRLRAVGLKPDGTPLDPTHLE